MQIAPFKAICPNLELIASADSFFDAVKFEYPQYAESGFFHEDADSALFILVIEGKDYRHSGIVCCVDIKDFLKGKIVKHEKTLADKEQKMMNLLLQRKAMVKPVLLMHPSSDKLTSFIKKHASSDKPYFKVHFEAENQTHKIFKLASQSAINELKAIYAAFPNFYIADGHHRVSTSVKLDKSYKSEDGVKLDFRNLMSVLFAYDQLEIHDYNRVVDITEDVAPPVLIAKISEICDIKVLKKATKPKRKYSFTMYMDHVWYGMRWKEEVIEKYARRKVVFDTEIMNREIFKKIMHIRDVRNDSRIKYAEGIVGIEATIDKANRGVGRVGFFLYPLTMEDLTQAADAGLTLPPKSTWFEPRIKNGLIAKSFYP